MRRGPRVGEACWPFGRQSGGPARTFFTAPKRAEGSFFKGPTHAPSFSWGGMFRPLRTRWWGGGWVGRGAHVKDQNNTAVGELPHGSEHRTWPATSASYQANQAYRHGPQQMLPNAQGRRGAVPAPPARLRGGFPNGAARPRSTFFHGAAAPSALSRPGVARRSRDHPDVFPQNRNPSSAPPTPWPKLIKASS